MHTLQGRYHRCELQFSLRGGLNGSARAHCHFERSRSPHAPEVAVVLIAFGLVLRRWRRVYTQRANTASRSRTAALPVIAPTRTSGSEPPPLGGGGGLVEPPLTGGGSVAPTPLGGGGGFVKLPPLLLVVAPPDVAGVAGGGFVAPPPVGGGGGFVEPPPPLLVVTAPIVSTVSPSAIERAAGVRASTCALRRVAAPEVVRMVAVALTVPEAAETASVMSDACTPSAERAVARVAV
mmetsp:Transcript_15905/g.36402  ORF Transcript_15905/g.36402 Transcript_15905/m.36402 type:complete len:236 (-) Transcript_15905:229-936(-)